MKGEKEGRFLTSLPPG